jgi:hypothetical protein
MITSRHECPTTRSCDNFIINKYADAKHVVELGAYEKCELRVYHRVTYDKKWQTEPTFKVSTTSSNSDVRYSYYDPWVFSRSYELSSGQLLKTG